METPTGRARAAKKRLTPAAKPRAARRKSAEKADEQKIAQFSPDLQHTVRTLRVAFGSN